VASSITIRLEKTQKQAIASICKAQGTSPTAYARKALADAIARDTGQAIGAQLVSCDLDFGKAITLAKEGKLDDYIKKNHIPTTMAEPERQDDEKKSTKGEDEKGKEEEQKGQGESEKKPVLKAEGE